MYEIIKRRKGKNGSVPECATSRACMGSRGPTEVYD